MKPRLAYFAIRYPTLSQTFIQREIEGLCQHGFEIWVFCCLPFKKTANPSPAYPSNFPVIERLTFLKILKIPYAILVLFFRKPSIFWSAVKLLRHYRWRGFENFSANFVGVCSALAHMGRMQTLRIQIAHGTWATMPAAAAATAAHLLKIPFSFGAHAYDIYRYGGDGFLVEKMRHAAFIHTTTQTNVDYLSNLLPIVREKIVLSRRGLSELPLFCPRNFEQNGSLRILSVGRLVAKKGHLFQLKASHLLQKQGWRFHLNIVGEGPQRQILEKTIGELNLEKEVTLLGALPADAVQEQYIWANLFWHTGIVDSEGDRDGLPNVVPEAMAHGIPIISSLEAGVGEAIQNRVTGLIVDTTQAEQIIQAIEELTRHPSLCAQILENARQWVEKNFLTQKNTFLLAQAFSKNIAT